MMKRVRASIPLALATFCLLWALFPAVGSAEPAPRETVEQATQDILATVRREEASMRGNPTHVRALIDQALAPYIDFPRMARLVLGKHWRSASSEQKVNFTREFRGLLVRFYSNALAEYLLKNTIPEDIEMTVLPVAQKPGDKRVTVRTRVQAAGRAPVPVNYSLYLNRGGLWKVYDVSVDGISLLVNYRTSFANQIRDKGIDGLIRTLADNNARA